MEMYIIFWWEWVRNKTVGGRKIKWHRRHPLPPLSLAVLPVIALPLLKIGPLRLKRKRRYYFEKFKNFIYMYGFMYAHDIDICCVFFCWHYEKMKLISIPKIFSSKRLSRENSDDELNQPYVSPSGTHYVYISHFVFH